MNKFNLSIGKNYFTNVYGLGRSFLALNTLTTLFFNDIYILYPEYLFDKVLRGTFIEKINLFLLFDYSELWEAKLISIVILLWVIVGVFPRITGLLHWWVSVSFFSSAILVEGGDQITANLTFLLIPITLMDNRKFHWNQDTSVNYYKNVIAYFSFFLIELQVAVLYLQAGVEKLYKLEEWRNGTAIYYWFNQSIFGAPDWILTWLNPLLTNPIFVSIGSWIPIFLELSLFGMLFSAKVDRFKLLPVAIMFHFLIAMIHGLPSFFLAMCGAVVLYLIPKDKFLSFDIIKLSTKRLSQLIYKIK